MATALRASPLFFGVSSHTLERLVAACWLKTLEPGERLFAEGEASRGLYVVQSGAIRLFRVNAEGYEQVIHIARARESFAEESLFADASYASDAAAVQSSRLVVVPRRELIAILPGDPELLLRLTSVLSRHMVEVIGLVGDLRLKSARVRLGTWLLQHCPQPDSNRPCPVVLSLPKKVLAAELGMVSETFSRVLAELQSEDLIVVRGRTVLLTNPALLTSNVDAEQNGLAPSRNTVGERACDRQTALA
jgi:CRP-like cAMP-binding protein